MAGQTNITFPVNGSNQSTSLVVSCGTSFGDVLNVTVWYNASTGYATPSSNNTVLTTISNTTANQTTFNATVTITARNDGKSYAFFCEPHNQTMYTYTGWNSTANANITVDNTAPTVILQNDVTGAVHENATYKKNTDKLTLNITISDATLGISDGAVCIVDVNGTNQTVGITKSSSTLGTCNSTAINLTGHADDHRQIRIYVNDSLNYALNQSVYVIIDTTGPSAAASCDPASVVKGSTLTCTCSASDATSGVNSSTSGSSITTTSTGSFGFTCEVTDNAGNSADHTFTYVVTGSGSASSSSGGGGGSSGTASSIKSNIFTKITPGNVSIVKNFDKETGVKEIQIEVNHEANSVKVTVSKYDGKPAEVSKEKSGNVYQYVQIKTENLKDQLKKAIVTIKVEKSWASNNGVDMNNVALFKFDDSTGEWNELTTTFKEQDDSYYYYDAELTSFSYFAISEKAVVEEEKKSITKDVTDSIKDTGQKVKEGISGQVWVIVVVVIVVLVVLLAMNKKKFKFLKR